MVKVIQLVRDRRHSQWQSMSHLTPGLTTDKPLLIKDTVPLPSSSPSDWLQVTTPTQGSPLFVCSFSASTAPGCACPGWLAEGANPSLFYKPQCINAVTKRMTRPRTEV